MQTTNYIELKNITKVYPNGVVANDHVNLGIAKGEIHAIAGENGAGKSTIMKVLYGAEHADGDIFIDGKKVAITSPKVANSLGIGMVYQHFMLVNEFSAVDNIFFGIEKKNKLGLLDKKAMHAEAEQLCQKYDMPVDLDELCGNMNVSTAQKVEILKVLARGANILILDEPTAVLTPQETEQLFKQLRLLKESGYTIIIITHKLKEIKELCDRITIMRDGKDVGVYNVSDVTESEISCLMVGHDISLKTQKEPAHPTETVLQVRDLKVAGKGGKQAVKGVSFDVRKGEIVCIAGVEGNGQQETVASITGLNRRFEGEILFNGVALKNKTIKKIRGLGMAHIPEDRLRTGADKDASIHENLISLDFAAHSTLGVLHGRRLKKRTNEQIVKYNIKGTASQPLGMLSGGNMQKVIVARELESNPVLVVADQPTRGIDVGAIEAIHKQLIAMRDEGKAVLLISADLSEVFNLADRILVFHEGEISAYIDDVTSIDEMELGKYMLGLAKRLDNAADGKEKV